MNEPAVTLPSREGLSVSNWIDAVCDQYEQGLLGGWSSLQAYLEACPPERRERLLEELLRLNWELAGPRTDPPSPLAECVEFPLWSGLIESTWQEFLQEESQSGAANEISMHSTVTPDPLETWVESASKPGDDSQPDFIGRYRVTRLLGEGAFGRVYQAEDDRLQRLVAIKVSRQQLLTPEEQAAALREARHLAALEHARIVPVYDAGQTDSGQLFIVSKWIDGASLEELLNQRRFSFRESAEIVAGIAQGLAHAHRRGVYHRDIKLANVLLDAAGQVYLTDFGLAVQHLDQGRQRGQVAGTPAYMSPEQARGETHRMDGRSDLWSLGVLLYRLLTGHLPFVGGSWQEMFAEIQERDPKPPRQWDDSIPEPLERIVLKCLAKPIADRYTTGTLLMTDLQDWLQQTRDSGVTRPGQQPEPGRKLLFSTRLGCLQIGLTICLLGLVAVGLKFAWPLTSASHRPGLVEVPPVVNDPTTPPDAPPVMAQQPELDGWIDVRIWKKEQGPPAGEGLRLHQSGVLPLRPGDHAQVEIQLNRSAYLYVVMLEAGGSVAPIYPWRNYDWSDRGPETARRELLIPGERSSASPLTAGPSGIECLLLLVRTTPLPAEGDAALASAFAAWQRQTRPPDPFTAVWLENGRPVSDEQNRARLGQTQLEIDNPITSVRQLLEGPLARWFDYTRAVCYSFQGE